MLESLQIKDWLVVASTVAGPILAVQAQKAVESIRERKKRKTNVFESLMATRAARLSAQHVQALNMIDLVFYGARVLGILRRTTSEQTILDAWKEYHDHLNTQIQEDDLKQWIAKGEELLINLLYNMANDVGYKFDRVQLKRGSYSPIAHENLELEQSQIRKHMLNFLAGNTPVKMEIVDFPTDEEAFNAQVETNRKLSEALNGERSLSIVLQAQENK